MAFEFHLSLLEAHYYFEFLSLLIIVFTLSLHCMEASNAIYLKIYMPREDLILPKSRAT
jgi:hypothetical protein